MNFLTNLEREQLKLQHRRERDGRIRDIISLNPPGYLQEFGSLWLVKIRQLFTQRF